MLEKKDKITVDSSQNTTTYNQVDDLFRDQFKAGYTNSDIGKGRGVYISTYGCQMNVNDTERMYSLLEMANFTPVSTPEQASLILINACSVREKPVHKVYSEVGHYKKLKDKNPDIRIGVGGCVGQQEKDTLIKNQPLIDFVFGTDKIDALPQLVKKAYEPEYKGLKRSERIVEAQFQHRAPYMVETLVRNPGVATFVNITKGCDNFCTFCVVPYTRGREKSRPAAHVIADIQNLVKRGAKEVTLVGQNVNSYEDEDQKVDFADLIAKVATETDIQRIRFITSHPKDFDQKLVETLYKHQPKACEYIHLPFQSGNSRILNLMNRGYTREQYLEKIAMIKKYMPNVVLSTDIIVGFPGETEEEFEDTVSLVKEVGFETIFAFMYSKRPFTKAARFDGQVDEDVKSRRLNRLFDEHDKMAMELAKKYDGQVLHILIEEYHADHGNFSGRSTHNKLTHVNFDFAKHNLSIKEVIGKTLPVKITKAYPATLHGEVLLET